MKNKKNSSLPDENDLTKPPDESNGTDTEPDAEKSPDDQLHAAADYGLTDELTDKITHTQTYLSGMYQNWFLDYASYVILERAVPHLFDGLKPVQRRILHSMRRMDDGRYNKVANIIGHTMQFHPHGDASIGDALVQLGQKELLIDAQGNWGNIYTGDSAAAPRYIEARLSKFALEVVFNPKTTPWKLSYDGRNQEPVTLPVKFPLLLAQGVEGIAVGLASKILPHNFIELIDASIAHLKNQPFNLMPDFPTGGLADCSKYNEGLRGGAVKIRARINKIDNKTLAVTEIPFGKTTTGLIDSIIKANDKGKIKIRKIDDNTAAQVEIMIHLAPGTSPDITIDALYAFTDCEISISPNCCVIDNDKPRFISVNEILRLNTQRTLELLKLELEIRRRELEDDWHLSSLEKIFIENRIYLSIEECETWEQIIHNIDKGLDPFKKKLRREVTRDDIVSLTEIKIKRISKFDAKKADEHIKNVEKELKQVAHHLAHLVEYTISYFESIKQKYGTGKDRKTELRSFDTIEASKVVIANQKLYVNKAEGFAGYGLKKDEYVCECSDIDDIIAFRRDGKYIVTKVAEKIFLGKDIVHIDVFKKNDNRTIYNVVYNDGKYGPVYMKRFAVTGITRDKEYDVTKGSESSRILYLSANPNGEAETVRVTLKPRPKMKKLFFDLDFSTLAIKGRQSLGNILTRYAIHRIQLKEKGMSTLGGRNIWWDETVLRINDDGRGRLLGEFVENDKILVIRKNGCYLLTSFDLANHYPDDVILIEKFNPRKVLTAVYFDPVQNYLYIKRFQVEETLKETCFISEEEGSYLVVVNDDRFPQFKVHIKGRQVPEIIDVDEFIAVKGVKARGKRLSNHPVERVEVIEPLEKEQIIELLDDEDSDNEPSSPETENKKNKDDFSQPEQMKIF